MSIMSFVKICGMRLIMNKQKFDIKIPDGYTGKYVEKLRKEKKDRHSGIIIIKNG